MINLVLWVVMALFPVSEISLALLRRSKARVAQGQDRGSLRLLWLAIVVGLGLANAAVWVPVGGLGVPPQARKLLALGLLLAGLAVRWIAILSLGQRFTVDVAVHSGQTVLQTGLYRFVRHPSYTGLLTAFLGLGVYSGSWLGILGLLVPVTGAIVNRVIKEERAMLDCLGSEYAAYCARTKRFIPGLI